MSSPRKTELNLSIDAELQEAFEELCEKEKISLAAAVESLMQECLRTGLIVGLSAHLEEMGERAFANRLEPIARDFQDLGNELGPLLEAARELSEALSEE